jgi:hypothetical protein
MSAPVFLQPFNHPPVPQEGERVVRVWRPDEDAALVSAVAKFGARKWKQVASEVSTRDHVQCAQRWLKALRPGLHKGQWKPQEDNMLLKLVGEHGTNWPKVAENWSFTHDFRVRTVKQIRERWNNHVDPAISRAPFSHEEDQRIIQLHRTLGNSWSAIAKNLPGRVGEAVKSRFKSLSRRQQHEPDSCAPHKKMRHAEDVKDSAITQAVSTLIGFSPPPGVLSTLLTNQQPSLAQLQMMQRQSMAANAQNRTAGQLMPTGPSSSHMPPPPAKFQNEPFSAFALPPGTMLRTVFEEFVDHGKEGNKEGNRSRATMVKGERSGTTVKPWDDLCEFMQVQYTTLTRRTT